MNMEDLPVSVARNLALIIAGLCLLPSQPSLAKTYKWVDENGVTQYTQTPPPKGDYKSIKTTKPAVDPETAKKQLQDRVDAYDERRKQAADSKAEANKQAANTAKKQADCDKAKKNLEYFETHTRIRFTDKDGNVSYLPEEERQKKMAASRENIKKLCN